VKTTPSALPQRQSQRLLSALILLAGLPLFGEPTAAATALVGDDLRIPEVFTSHLPQTLPPGDVRVSVHPHLGDFDARDFLRIGAGLRYGLTSKWEAGASTGVYFSHGLGDVAFFKRAGLYSLNLSTKYNLGTFPIAGWTSAIGFDFDTPVSRPPRDLTDGMRHYNPYFVSSRRLLSHPEIRIFWGAGVDLVSHTDLPRKLLKNQLDDNTTSLSGGIVWDRHSLHYTLEVAWDSTRLVGHNQDDTLTLRPGVIWEVPWFRSRKSGRIVLLGGSLRCSFGPDGTGLGAGAKLRVNFDPKRHEHRAPPEVSP